MYKGQNQAARRFDDLLKALASEMNDEGQQQPADQTGQPGESGPPGERVALLSQLKIVRSLQADLISRFEQVRQKESESGTLTDDQKKELAAIAEEQSQIADLIRELTSAVGDPEVPEEAEPGSEDDSTSPTERPADE